MASDQACNHRATCSACWATALILSLRVLTLGGCTDPAQEAEKAAREADMAQLFGATAALYTCEHRSVVKAGECTSLWQQYRLEKHTFETKYQPTTSATQPVLAPASR